MVRKRGFAQEVFVLYNRKALQKRFTDNIIERIQDEFVLCCDNVIFIEYEDKKRCDIREYIRKISSDKTHLIIIGNDNTLPFEQVKSPVSDGDSIVHTDNFWNCFDRDMIIPDFPVARIPHDKNQTAKSFISMLSSILSVKHLNHNERLGITASIWDKAAGHVFKTIKGTGDILNSPPFSVGRDGVLAFESFNGCIYCNVHGSDTLEGWYGQAKRSETFDDDFPLALMPETFVSGFESAMLISEACYGGFIIDKTMKKSIALSALNGGIACELISTSTAYGTFFPPVSEADLLVEYFMKNIYNNQSAGMALVKAKREFARFNIKENGYLDNDDRKTLLEFTLYGNPLLMEKK